MNLVDGTFFPIVCFSLFTGDSEVWLEGILLLCDDCNQWASPRSVEAISETRYAEIKEESRIICTG